MVASLRFKFKRTLGFSLVEILIALGLFSFAILAVIGLMGGALKQTRDSEDQMQAANLATVMFSQLREHLQIETTNSFSGSALPNVWPTKFPSDLKSLPTAVAASSFSTPIPITAQGDQIGAGDAAYALSWSFWQDANLPSAELGIRLIHCSFLFQWPAQAALNKNPANSYVATTSFLLTP